jgi:CubicO group peptidase (beta-lactamase class C family)
VAEDTCEELFRQAGSSGLAAVRDGEVLMALGDDRAVPVQSVTKLVVALGVGNALASIGDPVALTRRPLGDLVPELRGRQCADATLDQLLGHRSGLAPIPPHELEQSPDPVALALTSERVADSSSGFMYNNAGPFIVAHVVEQLTGRGVDVWLQQTVFDPLGCAVEWMQDAQGRVWAHGGLIASARVLALVGDAARSAALFPSSWVEYLVAAGASAFQQPGWVEQRITEATVASWRDAGIADEVIGAVGPITDGMSVGALMRQAPPGALSTLGAAVAGAGLRIAEADDGPVVGWGHDGDGGQWLIVCPEHEVALAHTRPFDSYALDPQFFPPSVVLDALESGPRV